MENETSDYEEENISSQEEEEEQKPIINPSDYVIRPHTSETTFGDLYCYHPDKYGNYQIVIPSMWPLYLGITIFMLIINIIFFRAYWNYLGKIPLRIGLFLYITSLITSIKVFLTNPGVPNTKTNSEITKLDDNDREFCEKCQVWNDMRQSFIHHCKECNCCIEDYELHSHFFGKCIAKGNYWTYHIYMVCNLLSIAFIIMIKGISS